MLSVDFAINYLYRFKHYEIDLKSSSVLLSKNKLCSLLIQFKINWNLDVHRSAEPRATRRTISHRNYVAGTGLWFKIVILFFPFIYSSECS